MRSGLAYRTRRFTLAPGGRLLLLTDGAPEALVAGDEPLGYEAFARLLAAARPQAEAWIDAVVAGVESRLVGARTDDWTLVAVERPFDGVSAQPSRLATEGVQPGSNA
jgi:serine phosphatase RsbU (regulator of sigma subunit)